LEREIAKACGERVRELRRAKGLSQEELADLAGLHRTYLGGIERGERNPSLKNIAAISKALGVRLSELFKLDP
jgi:transcriptional regulator with XRE-family HTH domain